MNQLTSLNKMLSIIIASTICLFITGCSSDDDHDHDQNQNAIFGAKRLLADHLIEKINNTQFEYNDEGLLTKVLAHPNTEHAETMTLTYDEGSTSIIPSKKIIAIIDYLGNSGSGKITIEMIVGDNGFISSAKGVDNYVGKLSEFEWALTYNSSNRLTSIVSTGDQEYDNYSVNWTYTGNNVTSTKWEVPNLLTQTSTIEYTSETQPTPIKNESGFPVLALTTSTGYLTINYLFIGGLMGYSLDDLPIRQIHQYNDDEKKYVSNLSWKLDSHNCPIEIVEKSDDDEDYITNITWGK